MKTLVTAFCFLISISLLAKAESGEKWAGAPKEMAFKKFKFMKSLDRTGKLSIFIRQAKPYFELSKAFGGDQTRICYGSSGVDPKTKKAAGISCVLSEIGARSCAKAVFKKCVADASIKPIDH